MGFRNAPYTQSIPSTLVWITLVVGMLFLGCTKKKNNEPQKLKIGIAVPAAGQDWAGGAGWWADYTVRNMQPEYPQIDFQVIHSADAVQQTADVEAFSVWGVNALVILPHDPAALAAPVKQLHDKGVRCVVVDRGLGDAAFGYVNLIEDNAGLGSESAKWLAAAMKEEGLANYLVIGSRTLRGGSVEMKAFFAEMDTEVSLVPVLGKDTYERIDGPAQNSAGPTEALLKRFPKIDAVFCQDDDALIAVLEAVRKSGRKDVQIITGGRGSKTVLRLILDGDPLVRAVVPYHPRIIADGIQYAVDVVLSNKSDEFHAAKSPVTELITPVLVDRTNAARYYEADSPF